MGEQALQGALLKHTSIEIRYMCVWEREQTFWKGQLNAHIAIVRKNAVGEKRRTRQKFHRLQRGSHVQSLPKVRVEKALPVEVALVQVAHLFARFVRAPGLVCYVEAIRVVNLPTCEAKFEFEA